MSGYEYGTFSKGYWYRCVDCGQVFKDHHLYTIGVPPPHPECPEKKKKAFINMVEIGTFEPPLTVAKVREIVLEEIAKWKEK